MFLDDDGSVKKGERMREDEAWELQRMRGRRMSVPPSTAASDVGVSAAGGGHHLSASQHHLRMIANAEDLHAWSIYRQVII